MYINNDKGHPLIYIESVFYVFLVVNGSPTLCLFNRRAREEVQVKIVQDDVAPGEAPTDQGGVFRKKRKERKNKKEQNVKKKEGKPKKKKRKERKKEKRRKGREEKKEVGWEEGGRD